ncbi:MAG: hypothetical protein NZO58_14110, partial [Gemmataceae bacterium]|nr:hypothetical protein [Gemmataceae bacterium]
PGMVATVKVFSPTDLGVMNPVPRRTFEPFGKGFKNGIFVAVGDVNGDQVRELHVSADKGWLPLVMSFDGQGLMNGGVLGALSVLPRYQPFPNHMRVGVRTVAKPTDGGNPGFVEKIDLFHALGKGGGMTAKKVVLASFRGVHLDPRVVDRLFERATYDGIFLG